MYSIVYNMSVLGKTPPKGDSKSQQTDFTHPGSSNEAKDSPSEQLPQEASIRELKKPSTSLFQEMRLERSGKCSTNRKGSAETPRCRCKMSRCIRYYCDCFNAGLMCGRDCSCQDCQNNPDNQQLLLNRQKSKSKDKGCFCTKSNCQKKYCVCFSQGEKCKPTCKCKNCQNIPEQASQHREEPLLQSQDPIEAKGDMSEQVSPLEGSSYRRMEEQQFDEVEEKEKQIWDYLIEQ